mgnify:CR=1 FL=1
MNAESRPWRRVRDGALACVAGLGVGGAAWAVMTRPLDSISGYFWDNAYSGGGGTNVVNVILVDFRGFDTFGEIIVLGIAALGIFSLLETVGTGASGRRVAAWKPDTVRSPEHHPMMLVVATRLLLPLAVAVGLYIFLRGHNQPGGGFIAGLVISIAILMQYMASGYSFADQRLRADHHTLIGAGVLTAAATGLGSLLFGAPFLTSAFDYFSLPLIGEFELATAMLFDVGVALTVVGAVMSEDKLPLPGVNVLVKGTTIGTVTDVNGNYRIAAPDDATTLVFSSVGYSTEEIEIGGRTVINIELAPDIQALSEVVVTALGIEKVAKTLGYATA